MIANVAVILTAFATYLIDTIRRHLHLQIMLPAALRTYRGAAHCFETIVAHHGVSGLFAGFSLNALRIVGAALTLVLYGELTAKWASESSKAGRGAREATPA